MECEYFEDFGWLYDELREKFKVDYLILGCTFFSLQKSMALCWKY